MAAWFERETSVLNYGPRAHADPGRRNDRVWLFWPAWAFRVIAPRFRRRSFNTLQKAVLGVLRASRLTAVELGERLGIHRELAAFVVAELQHQGRVDDKWAVTRRAIQLLDDEREESAQLVPGWVFKDPWNDHLWPFVAPSLEYAETGQDANGRVVLELGTTGKPWHQQVWRQSPPGGPLPTAPDAHQILRAARRHRQLERRGAEINRPIDEDEAETGSVGGLDLNRVASIEPLPVPMFLVSFLYVPHSGDDMDWHACEFFGRGSDPTLRRLVAEVAENNEGLARRLDRLLGLTPHENFDEFRRGTKNRERRSRLRLERALTIDIARHAKTADALAEMIDAWLEWRDLGDAAGPRHGRGVLTSCRYALEQLFAEVRQNWPLTGVADRLPRDDREMKEALLQAAADELQLTDFPEALRRVKPGQVRAVSDYDDAWRLRPLVVATLLAAQTDPNHPLRSAARKAPDLLRRIEHVAKVGGEATHGDPGESVNASVEETLEIVGFLLNLPARPIKEITADGEEPKEPPE